MGIYCLMSTSSVLEDEKVVKMDGGDDYTTVWMDLTLLNHMSNGQDGNFYIRMYILMHTHKKDLNVWSQVVTGNTCQWVFFYIFRNTSDESFMLPEYDFSET